MESNVVDSYTKYEPCKVIGISGPSASGKTTLAERLQQELPKSAILSLDRYTIPRNVTIFHHPNDSNTVYQNWETVETHDFDLLLEDVIKLKQSGEYSYLIVEGFLLFADSILIPHFDVLIFFDFEDWKELAKRRVKRSYGFTMDMYEHLVWPYYLQYKPTQISNVRQHLQQLQQISKFLLLQCDFMDSSSQYTHLKQHIVRVLSCS